MKYFVVYQSAHSTCSYPYNSYTQARLALAKFTATFAREGATVLAHNDNYANLVCGKVPFTLTIYNNYWR